LTEHWVTSRTPTEPTTAGEMHGLLSDKQVMRLYGFAEKLLSID